PDFNADAAKKALADAGFANGAGLPPIKLTFSNTPRNRARFQWVQNQLKINLGIDAGLDPVESKAYTALTKSAATTPQMFYLGWCQDYPDPQDWYTLVFRSDSTVTHVGWKNAQLDQLTTAGDIEKDAAKRDADYKQAAQILSREAPVVFMYWDVADTLIKPYVTGMKDHVSTADRAFPGDRNIENIDITK
ncbi:MAG: ABC transporter substrate-binding protein, partial [Actinomycetota bacterium]|nr:ABC transporter substrate-binding protein [Actinomycetota bacterium]